MEWTGNQEVLWDPLKRRGEQIVMQHAKVSDYKRGLKALHNSTIQPTLTTFQLKHAVLTSAPHSFVLACLSHLVPLRGGTMGYFSLCDACRRQY